MSEEKKKSLVELIKEKKAAELNAPESTKVEEPKAEEPKAEEPKAEEPKAEEPKAKPKARKKPQAKSKGFDLIVNATPVKGVEAVGLSEFFDFVTGEMLKSMGEDSWYDLDPFKRRELFHQHSPAVVAMAEGKTIVVKYIEPDMLALVNVLYYNAKTIIEGVK